MKIEIYHINPIALDEYRKNTRNGADSPTQVIERKLTALALNAQIKTKVFEEKYAYRFGQFGMIINERTKNIEVIYWEKKPYYLSPQQIKKLEETYDAFGLTRKGNSFKEAI